MRKRKKPVGKGTGGEYPRENKHKINSDPDPRGNLIWQFHGESEKIK